MSKCSRSVRLNRGRGMGNRILPNRLGQCHVRLLTLRPVLLALGLTAAAAAGVLAAKCPAATSVLAQLHVMARFVALQDTRDRRHLPARLVTLRLVLGRRSLIAAATAHNGACVWPCAQIAPVTEHGEGSRCVR